MKKKILCAVLVLSLAAGGTACGGKRTQPDDIQQEEQDTKQDPDAQQEEQDTKQDPDTQQDQHVQEGQGGEEEQGEPYEAQLPIGKEDADIYIEPVEGISEDFIRGMDVSSVIAQEESGVVYYNEQGEQEDLFRVLADAGVNYIRARVWNDPYDKDGNGYGGGNCDAEKAAKIGARAAQNGMKLLVDFHYSDLWADSEKQFAPKAWAHMTLEEKQQALYEFTKESLQTIIDAGGEVGIVQIGNEINHGMAGEEWEHIVPLLEQGSRAVRETAEERGLDIRIAVHFTAIDDHDQTVSYAKTLADAGLDYDIFGVSYYPYWHGTMKHMETVLKDIRNSYGKETLVLETAYCYTLEDGDGFANSIGKEELVDGYTASVQSQASCVRDVMAAAASAEALGVFYWEGAWTAVGTPQQLEDNQKLWEQYGSGWASSYAAKYDKEDAGKNYGGCAWDNQAMFDAAGHPLASLNVFRYLEYGTSCEQAVDYIKETKEEVYLGDSLQMPETVDVVYNDRSLNGPAAVVWDQAQLDKIKTDQAGEYMVDGRLEDGTPAACRVVVANKNWLLNPGFEKNDISMWKVSYKGASNPTDIQEKEADAKSGVNSFHFWSEQKQNFRIEQTVSGLKAGTYEVSANIQGGDAGPAAKICLYAVVNGKTFRSKPVELKGWNHWKKPKIKGLKLDEDAEVTVGMKVKCAGGGWGTMDDFALIKTGEF